MTQHPSTPFPTCNRSRRKVPGISLPERNSCERALQSVDGTQWLVPVMSRTMVLLHRCHSFQWRLHGRSSHWTDSSIDRRVGRGSGRHWDLPLRAPKCCLIERLKQRGRDMAAACLNPFASHTFALWRRSHRGRICLLPTLVMPKIHWKGHI